MKAYIIVDVVIQDPVRYDEYKKLTPGSLVPFDGKFLVRGGTTETLEGDWNPHRVAMLRFPSYAQAKAFYEDAQYTRVRGLRAGATEYFNMVLVEGLEAPI